jgi:hypothetical protein
MWDEVLLTYTATLAAAAGRKSSGNKGFTRSRRAVEEYTTRRRDTHLLEHVRVQEREKGHFLEFRDICGNLSANQRKKYASDSRSSSPPTSSNEMLVFTPSGSASARAGT